MIKFSFHNTGEAIDPVFIHLNEFLENVFSILKDYSSDFIQKIEVQWSPEEDWTPTNLFNLLESLVPESEQDEWCGLDVYYFDDFTVFANPDQDVIEVMPFLEDEND